MNTSRKKSLKQLSCKAGLPLIIVLIAFTLATAGLSIWQFSKGMHAAERESALVKADQQETLGLTAALQTKTQSYNNLNGRKVKFSGKLQALPLVFHDNRIFQSIPGYGVYGLIQLDINPLNSNYTHALIHMGWHAWPNKDRQLLPKIQIKKQFLNQQLEFEGIVENINSKIFTLSKNSVEAIGGDVLRLQTINFKALEESLEGYKLLPFVIHAQKRLTQPELPSLAGTIKTRGITAAKHYGYGVQWLCFLLIGLGIFIYTQCQFKPSASKDNNHV